MAFSVIGVPHRWPMVAMRGGIDPELVDGHAGPASQDEVAELVGDDEHHEHDQHQGHIDQTIQGVCLPAAKSGSGEE